MTEKEVVAYNFGNELGWCDEEDEYYYIETNQPNTLDVYMNLICPKCKKKPTKDGHDPCIKNLPGVKFACCGHGVSEGYVWFEDGTMIRGNFNIRHQEHLDKR